MNVSKFFISKESGSKDKLKLQLIELWVGLHHYISPNHTWSWSNISCSWQLFTSINHLQGTVYHYRQNNQEINMISNTWKTESIAWTWSTEVWIEFQRILFQNVMDHKEKQNWNWLEFQLACIITEVWITRATLK